VNRPPDLSFEALVEMTGATVSSERGALNTALKMIREEMPGVDDTDLATEIVYRAGLYRKRYPNVSLTPTALAKHWYRVLAEAPKPPAHTQEPTICETCKGDRFVLVRKRPGEAKGMFFEEYAACPDCADGIVVDYWRADGTKFVAPDRAQVREMMGE
jgi:hypothetical protein